MYPKRRFVEKCVYISQIQSQSNHVIMDMCKNMITNMNVRKLWKNIRARHFKRTRNPKLDSDSILHDMRQRTDMPVQERAEIPRASLEYKRDRFGEYNVKYFPMTFDRAFEYRSSRRNSYQDSFDQLCVSNNYPSHHEECSLSFAKSGTALKVF